MTKKNKIYFGEFEEEQFLKFINEDNDFERNKIYSRYLHEPFKRMINLVLKSLVNINPSIESFDSLEEQMLGHLANAIPTYKPENGRAYTYFSYVLRNYGWELLREGKKMQNTQTPFEYNVGEDEFEHSDFLYEMDEDIEKHDKLIKCVKDRIENTLNNRFVNIKDALVGKTLVELLNNSDIVLFDYMFHWKPDYHNQAPFSCSLFVTMKQQIYGSSISVSDSYPQLDACTSHLK